MRVSFHKVRARTISAFITLLSTLQRSAGKALHSPVWGDTANPVKIMATPICGKMIELSSMSHFLATR